MLNLTAMAIPTLNQQDAGMSVAEVSQALKHVLECAMDLGLYHAAGQRAYFDQYKRSYLDPTNVQPPASDAAVMSNHCGTLIDMRAKGTEKGLATKQTNALFDLVNQICMNEVEQWDDIHEDMPLLQRTWHIAESVRAQPKTLVQQLEASKQATFKNYPISETRQRDNRDPGRFSEYEHLLSCKVFQFKQQLDEKKQADQVKEKDDKREAAQKKFLSRKSAPATTNSGTGTDEAIMVADRVPPKLNQKNLSREELTFIRKLHDLFGLEDLMALSTVQLLTFCKHCGLDVRNSNNRAKALAVAMEYFRFVDSKVAFQDFSTTEDDTSDDDKPITELKNKELAKKKKVASKKRAAATVDPSSMTTPPTKKQKANKKSEADRVKHATRSATKTMIAAVSKPIVATADVPSKAKGSKSASTTSKQTQSNPKKSISDQIPEFQYDR